ncbi:hypothetical protein ABZ915_14470 [Streptomyces sp. NPDC046915]|uniref:hypothetical protein n=1 Tax=Streptomyces sp. NPDC046915 TaxID=3155257 RepID=UPI0033D6E355
MPISARQGGEALMNVSTAGLDAWASIVVDGRYVTLRSSVKTDAWRSRLHWGVVKKT